MALYSVHIIYTYNDNLQEHETLENVSLIDKDTFLNTVRNRSFANDPKAWNNIIRMSICVQCKEKDLPAWVNECDGKIIMKDGNVS